MWKRLENWKRNIESIKKGLDFATEQINARSENIKQYENTCDQFLQNRLFQNKQKKNIGEISSYRAWECCTQSLRHVDKIGWKYGVISKSITTKQNG